MSAAPPGASRLAVALLAAAVFSFAVAAPGRAADTPDGAVSDSQHVQLIYRPPAAATTAADSTAVDSAEPPERRTRALLEFTVLLLGENIRYWSENAFVEDWQFELSWEDQTRKLFELDGVRFDSNQFGTNWTHAWAGGLYYSLGRDNNLGVKDSLLLTVFETLYWELVVEWREVLSVNDVIMTAVGGFSTGEPYYQLSRYLLTRANPVSRALGFINPVLGMHTILDPASRPRPTEAQTLPGHGVSLALGAATVDSRYASDSGEFAHLGLRSRLALAPGYTTPGSGSRQGWEVLSSTANFAADIGGGEVRELDAFSRAVFYGWLQRDVAADLRGSGAMLGLGSAFTLFRKAPLPGVEEGAPDFTRPPVLEGPRDFRDKYSIIHLVGPVYEGYWRAGALSLCWGLEAYPDFALVNAYALNEYSAGHDIAGMKTTMVYSGYYYGFGGTAQARLDAGIGPVAIGAAGALHYHESIEGLDRFEERLAGDVHAADTWLQLDANLGVPIPRTPLALEATARWVSRRGEIGDTVSRGTESRYGLALTCRL